MFRALVEIRGLTAMMIAAATGVWGVITYPPATDNVFLQLIALREPVLFRALVHGYAALWFSTSFLAASLVLSVATVLTYRRPPMPRARPLPRYAKPETRPTPSLVLGETHHVTTPGPAPEPTWLTIPQRGLYTGVMILGAVGTGKTSACMYPYVEQLLRWRAQDPDHKVGGLVLEVKGDFCHQVRDILSRAGRGDDYLEIGLDTGFCYNPLHNDLDPYAVAYAVATLLNNLFGRGKEPFWQQAYTDLLKFVISLRRITEGYTTLSEVYRYIINDSLIDQNIRDLKNQFREPREVIVVSNRDYETQVHRAPWTLWEKLGAREMAHQYAVDLEGFLAAHDIPFAVRQGTDAICSDRRHRLDAIDRWFHGPWAKLDNKVKASIVEGVVVFLSLFDENPAVYKAFCPSRASYANTPEPGQPQPLPPLEDLVEKGRVLGLNFPVALNPALARGLGVMLKLDFQRAVLNRIPKIAADPRGQWRDILFVADEYHAFATVGETDPTGDERAFALSRQARLIPIVATQSISSLRSALAGDDAWRTLLQCFRTKLFLATSDELTARVAAELCGRADQLKARYTIAETGIGAHISLLSGKAAAEHRTLGASKSYTFESDYIFQPRVFMELQNAQAVALPYDGLNPLPPQYCYLKPYYLDVQTSYFEHLAQGAL
ncbi:MAG: type IV secretory system conjugative DNA transfer family protein [Vicinamibacteraceae bacterium]